MRAVCFVDRLEWDVPGTVCRHAIAIGDVDNDGENELVIGTNEGELYIFKGEELWQKISDLGFITCVAIGDVFNYGRNALVLIGGEGWVNIYYSPKSVNPSASSLSESKKSAQASLDFNLLSASITATNSDQTEPTNEFGDYFGKMECVHVQRIPPNTKVVLIADVDNDNSNEMILGLTDRVVRSYRWSSNADLETGRLVGLNKWECASQIGTITLQHTENGTPTLLVAQPGGTIMKIKCNPDDCFFDETSDTNKEVTANYVDYQTIQSPQIRNPNISTEVLGDLDIFIKSSKTEEDEIPDFKPVEEEKSSESIDQIDGNLVGGTVILGEPLSEIKKDNLLPTFKDFIISKKDENFQPNSDCTEKQAEPEKTAPNFVMKPYVLATLDGTIILLKEETISWAIQVDHPLFALCRLDVTRDGADEIVACAWDGQTYILDQHRNCVQFQFEEPVMAFCTGFYNANSKIATPCFVYKTFNNKVYLYYDVTLKSMTLKSLNRLDIESVLDSEQKKILDNILNDADEKSREKKLRELTRWLLYKS